MAAHSEEALAPRHTVAVGLAVVSPASSFFAILIPVMATTGPATRPSFVLAAVLGSLVATTYIASAEGALAAPGEPHWVATVLGPAWGAALKLVTVMSLLVVGGVLLQALAALLGLTAWWQLAAAGGVIVLAALLGVRRTLWLIILGLAVELTALALVTGAALRATDGGFLGPGPARPSFGLSGAQLAAVPTMLFALNGYGQAAYLVGDHDRARRVRRAVWGTFVLALAAEGLPLLALSRAVPISSPAARFPLVSALAALHAGAVLVTCVRLGIGFALANALLAVLHVGVRLLAPLPRAAPARIAARDTLRSRTVLLGVAMVCVAALPAHALTLGAGQTLVLVYLMVAVAAARVATRPWRRCVALLQSALMLLLLTWEAATERGQAAVTLTVFAAGLLAWGARRKGSVTLLHEDDVSQGDAESGQDRAEGLGGSGAGEGPEPAQHDHRQRDE